MAPRGCILKVTSFPTSELSLTAYCPLGFCRYEGRRKFNGIAPKMMDHERPKDEKSMCIVVTTSLFHDAD
jgi:hypothetical protein